jgi:monofunctional glycosyltransferase
MKRKKKRRKNRLAFLLRVTVVLSVLFLIFDIAYYGFVVDIQRLENKNPEKTAFMKYRERQWRRNDKDIRISQRWVGLSRISRNARRAVVVAEDGKFWNHNGFDYDAIQNAVERNIEERRFKLGASTITQQLAKNLYLSPSKDPLRKLNEAILTRRIEQTLSKSRILELYLNVIEWGRGIFGIEVASWHYFGKSASGLTVSEAALLAAVLPNPIRYSPANPSPYIKKRAKQIAMYVR